MASGGLPAIAAMLSARDQYFRMVSAVLAAALSRPQLTATVVREAGLKTLLEIMRLTAGGVGH